jgi:HAD superfamily hydrolase (TIGR01458 family)
VAVITTSGARICAVLLDIQGTLLGADSAAVPRAPESVERLRSLGLKVRFVTNIDSVGPGVILDRLRSAGFVAGLDEIFSPVSACKRFLEAHGRPRVHLLVPEQIEADLAGYARGSGEVRFVIVGDCREGFTWQRLNEAFRALEAGAGLIALQKGRYFLAGDGPTLDTGAFVSALEYGSGREAYVIGKPSVELLRMAVASAACEPRESVMVGDDVHSDIPGGIAIGSRTVLVRTGKYTLDSYERAGSKPDLVLDSVAALPESLGEF